MIDWNEQISDGAVLLTVNQRLSRHHMQRYQQWQLDAGRSYWETPVILPYRSWMISAHRQALALGLSNVTVVSALLAQQAWRKIIDSDASVQLLDAAGATRSATQAWELSCAWQCRNPEDHYLSADQFTWQRWMLRYRSWLDAREAIDEPLLAEELMAVFARASHQQLQSLLPRTLILDGFLQLPRQVDELIEAVKANGTHVQVHTPASKAHLLRTRYKDDEAELLSIATQMRTELEYDQHQLLGLVVPNLQQRRDAVVRAFEQVFYPGMSPLAIRAQRPAYEISLGQLLADQPVVASALLLLQLCARSISGNELSTVLLSPYWLAAQTEARRREQLDRRLREKRVRVLSIDQLSALLYKGSRLTPAIKKLARVRKMRSTTLTDWASRFSLWLKTVGWPGESSVDSEEYQAVSAWLECLDDMQLLDEGESVAFSTAIDQLRTLASERVFQLETPATPIQVMGSLESHGLEFDCLWVTGLDGEQWPPAGSPSAFLLISEQKACNVPDSSAAQRLALAEKEFYLWSSQAPLLVTSSAETRNGKELIEATLPEFNAENTLNARGQAMLTRIENHTLATDPATLISQSMVLESIRDDYGPELPESTKVDGGARLFENQALCPFRAFALHRLKVRPLEEVGLGLDPRQHGTLLHGALELFWQEVRTHERLLSLENDALDSLLHDVIEQSMQSEEVPDEFHAMEQTRLTALLRDWLMQCEAPRQPFEVVQLESKQRIEHGGVLMDVIIDRVDKVDDALLVIDYKTGANNRVTTWADERISNPQLPLYVLTDENMAAASFAQIASNQCKFIGIASDEQMLPKVSTKLKASGKGDDISEPITEWSQWRTHWRSSLDNIAQELRQGIATVSPMKNACMYCELISLCRINDDKTKNDEAESLYVSVKDDGANGVGES